MPLPIQRVSFLWTLMQSPTRADNSHCMNDGVCECSSNDVATGADAASECNAHCDQCGSATAQSSAALRSKDADETLIVEGR